MMYQCQQINPAVSFGCCYQFLSRENEMVTWGDHHYLEWLYTPLCRCDIIYFPLVQDRFSTQWQLQKRPCGNTNRFGLKLFLLALCHSYRHRNVVLTVMVAINILCKVKQNTISCNSLQGNKWKPGLTELFAISALKVIAFFFSLIERNSYSIYFSSYNFWCWYFLSFSDLVHFQDCWQPPVSFLFSDVGVMCRWPSNSGSNSGSDSEGKTSNFLFSGGKNVRFLTQTWLLALLL